MLLSTLFSAVIDNTTTWLYDNHLSNKWLNEQTKDNCDVLLLVVLYKLLIIWLAQDFLFEPVLKHEWRNGTIFSA